MIVNLTKRDVEQLLTNPSPEARADTARKIAEDFQDEAFSPEQREMALQIFEIMAKDAEIRVRMALSEHLKECPDIPHDIAMALAQDVERRFLKDHEGPNAYIGSQPTNPSCANCCNGG